MRHKTSERQEASLKLILPLSWALSFYEKNANYIKMSFANILSRKKTLL